MRCSLSRVLCLATLAILSVQSCSSRTGLLWESFSGEKAFAHVQQLVDLGPRPAGSEALEKSRLYIIDQLKSAGWTVARSEFSDQTPRGKMTFVNLIARDSLCGRKRRWIEHRSPHRNGPGPGDEARSCRQGRASLF